MYHITQRDDRITEVEMTMHINLGGNLSKAVVNGFILPSFNWTIGHQQTYFINSVDLENMSVEDGKLLGEVLINQI